MKLSCLQENLSRGLAITGRALVGRASDVKNPNVVIATEQGRMSLMANGGRMCVKTITGAMVEEEGEVMIPHRLLTELVQSLPSDRVDLEVTPGADGQGMVMHIACSRAYARMQTVAASMKPLDPTITEAHGIDVVGQTLSDAITKVAFCAGEATDREVLSAIHTQIRQRDVVMATADGHRLTKHTWIHETAGPEEPFTIQPSAACMREVARILVDEEARVRMAVSDDGEWVVVKGTDTVVKMRQIKGAYPNYEQLIPDQHTTAFSVESADLKQAAQQASIFANAGSNIIRMEIAKEPDESGLLTISSRSEEVGNNRGQMKLDQVEGESNRVAINVRYMNDLIAVAGKNKIEVRLTNGSSPITFLTPGGPDWLHIAMPMYVQW